VILNPLSVGIFVDDKLCAFDAIESEAGPLIVVLWFGNQAEGVRRPEYVIPLRSVRHQVDETGTGPVKYLVNDPMPKSLFDGSASRQQRRRFHVRSGPEIHFPIAQNRH
jgi:hypothetical protein